MYAKVTQTILVLVKTINIFVKSGESDMGFVGFEEVEMTKTEETLSDLDQVIIKDSFDSQILVLVDSPKMLIHRFFSINWPKFLIRRKFRFAEKTAYRNSHFLVKT